MKKLIYILEHATCRSLILIDEIGSGTDPQEGACLGEAILDTLLRRDCRIVASTTMVNLRAMVSQEMILLWHLLDLM